MNDHLSVLLAIVLTVLATLVARPAHAADPSLPALPDNIGTCQACHGLRGISSSPVIPNLAGQKADYLVAQLQAFKNGGRRNDFMTVIAGQLSEADIPVYAKYWSAQPAANAAATDPKPVPAIPSRAALAADFPTGYTVYESIPDAKSATVTRRYANSIAIKAAHAGQPLPDGSVIVVTNSAKDEAPGRPGAVKSYAIMESRAGWGAAVPALLKNGNWDYAVFDANRVRKDGLNQALCLACHKPAAADSYVFTLKALRAAATKRAS